MKKNILSVVLVSGLVLGGAVSASAVVRDAVESTTGTVTLTPQKNPGTVDPGEPIDPSIPGDGGETGQTGLLTLDVVPSFGFTAENDDQGLTGKFISGAATTKGYVQVSDRRGTLAGWSVDLSISPFQLDGTGAALNGTTISLPFALSATNVSQEGLSVKPVDKTAVATDTSTELGRIFTGAEGNSGRIQNMAKVENASITIDASANNAAGTYESTFTWSLYDAPEAGAVAQVEDEAPVAP